MERYLVTALTGRWTSPKLHASRVQALISMHEKEVRVSFLCQIPFIWLHLLIIPFMTISWWYLIPKLNRYIMSRNEIILLLWILSESFFALTTVKVMLTPQFLHKWYFGYVMWLTVFKHWRKVLPVRIILSAWEYDEQLIYINIVAPVHVWMCPYCQAKCLCFIRMLEMMDGEVF